MKILIVQTSFLGDVILSTPVISNLKKLYPIAEIDIVTTPVSRGLVCHHLFIRKAISFDKRGKQKSFFSLLNFARELRKEKYDLVVSLHKSLRTSVLVWLIKSPLSYGFKESSASFLYSKTIKFWEESHAVLRNLSIMKLFDLKLPDLDQKMHLAFSKDEKEAVVNFLEKYPKKPLIGIAPGSVWHTKRWTAEGFASVANDLVAKGYGVVLIGGPDDRDIADKIKAEVKGDILDLVGKTSLPTSAEMIGNCDVLISNDSSPLHIASAMSVPVVALFCSTIPEFGFGPWKVKSKVLGVEGLDCRPCGDHGRKVCPLGTYDCQKMLSPKSVIDAVEELLESPSIISYS